ncbi:unnamed protein product [Leptidea sinapis]|uniref:Homeobox domain-containing protein n=1 Tax=Leptidea sinapis TaxID=189913 RepID=A0A5E4QR07_9NEOP|nr:unnamed protein product [Leptidea sinapis]
MTEVKNDLDAVKLRVNLEQRRNTYPLYPMPVKANMPWPMYRMKGYEVPQQSMNFYSEPVLNSDHILRSQLSVNRFLTPYSVRQPYNFDRGVCCNGWWGVGGRRKGGQVRFSAAQTGALERRFSASKYLSENMVSKSSRKMEEDHIRMH